MMLTRFARFVLECRGRLAMPIGAYAGLGITGATVEEAVSSPEAQVRAVMALHERFGTSVLMTAMDLSAEADAYGCEIRMSGREVPTVVGRMVTDAAGIESLPDPEPGDGRTRVPLETAWCLTAEAGEDVPVLGCMLGPFSLAARLFGVGEALEATAVEPDLMEALVERVTGFLKRYALAFRETGAWGVIVAEPAAGLLSPTGVGRFSAPFVRRIVETVEGEGFAVILHNCGARLVHLEATLGSGAGIYHFGAPMDIVAALERVSRSEVRAEEESGRGIFLRRKRREEGDKGAVSSSLAENGPILGDREDSPFSDTERIERVCQGDSLSDAQAPTIIGGNLDPAAVFHNETPEMVRQATRELLEATRGRRNFIISSGCDIPPGTPLENLAAFFEEVERGDES